MASCKFFLFLALFSAFQLLGGLCFTFKVGDDHGWMIPSANSTNMYSDWASKNRFQVGDTVHFEYTEDSVLVVTETEYEQCDSSQPIFFSNNGDTDFVFDRSGLFYFISGVSGHCQQGQKMIIKVLARPTPPASLTESSETPVETNMGSIAKSFAPILIFSQMVILGVYYWIAPFY